MRNKEMNTKLKNPSIFENLTVNYILHVFFSINQEDRFFIPFLAIYYDCKKYLLPLK